MKNKTLICVLFVSLCFAVTHFVTPVNASYGGNEELTVNAAWFDGDMLKITVTNADGVTSDLALYLKDYVSDTENKEYISIQAVDLEGNKSDIVEIKNPYYIPPADTDAEESETPEISQSALPDSSNPFTPDGTGTVIDNVTNGDGKEFFTIDSEAGNVFYLIIDRQKNTDNVYLLNAVTEDDLMALAEKSGKPINHGSTSAIPQIEPETTSEQKQPVETVASPEAEPSKNTEKNNIPIFIIIAIAIAGGAVYYFKVVRGRKNTVVSDDADEDDDYEYDDEYNNDHQEDDE